MFSAHCDRCGTEVLLSSRRIVSLRHTDRGIVVVFRCWEGHLGSWLTGRRAATRGPGPDRKTARVERERARAAGEPEPTPAWDRPRLTDVWREPRPARI